MAPAPRWLDSRPDGVGAEIAASAETAGAQADAETLAGAAKAVPRPGRSPVADPRPSGDALNRVT
jgi:hypothetical protein